jgi:ribosome biogenesis GTPase
MQEFGLHHIDRDALAWGFVEFRQHIGQCRFNNCRHASEPGCALVQAVREGKISARRLAFYQKLAK